MILIIMFTAIANCRHQRCEGFESGGRASSHVSMAWGVDDICNNCTVLPWWLMGQGDCSSRNSRAPTLRLSPPVLLIRGYGPGWQARSSGSVPDLLAWPYRRCNDQYSAQRHFQRGLFVEQYHGKGDGINGFERNNKTGTAGRNAAQAMDK